MSRLLWAWCRVYCRAGCRNSTSCPTARDVLGSTSTPWYGFICSPQRGEQREHHNLTVENRLRGYGAVGSASAWHAEGQGFESPYLHKCNVSGHRSYGVPTFFMLWGFDVSGHRSAFSGDVSGHRSVLQASQGLPRNALLALRMRRSPGLFCFAASVARCRRVSQVTAQPPP